MKKIILIAGVLTASVLSAKTISFKNVKGSESKILKKASKAKTLYPIYYTTSCGLQCMTDQSCWGSDQMFAWAAALEENYCAD